MLLIINSQHYYSLLRGYFKHEKVFNSFVNECKNNKYMAKSHPLPKKVKYESFFR